jgi:hypothetical protein
MRLKGYGYVEHTNVPSIQERKDGAEGENVIVLMENHGWQQVLRHLFIYLQVWDVLVLAKAAIESV